MLEQVAIFAGLPPAELEAIEHCAVVRHFPKNTVMLVEGDLGDSLYFILEGRVKVYLTDDQGHEIVVNIKDAGDYFGELAALGESPRAASVMTLEQSKFAIVPSDELKTCLKRHPDIALYLIRTMSRHIRDLTENVRDLALLDVYQRVSRFLQKQAIQQNGKWVITQRPSQQEIANHVGASREMISRVLRELAIGGYLAIADKTITIEKKFPAGW
jgi:CRP/FNR family transcriptional regulator, cyclic AMP receptor protein